MNLSWKITVWVNLIWIIVGTLYSLGNNTFGWIQFIYGAITVATSIKCLELAKELEFANKKLEVKEILK